jgi:hypothetical protein
MNLVESAASAWGAVAKQLNDRQQLEAACRTICILSKQPSARSPAVAQTVVGLELPSALVEATAAVLNERKQCD